MAGNFMLISGPGAILHRHCGSNLPQANQLNVTALLAFPTMGGDAIVLSREWAPGVARGNP
jgi:hypothetical protein